MYAWLERFILSRKCVNNLIEDKVGEKVFSIIDDVRESARKTGYNNGYVDGSNSTKNTVKIEVSFADNDYYILKGAAIPKYCVANVDISETELSRSDDKLTCDKVIERIQEICRECIKEEGAKEGAKIYNRNIVEIDTPQAMLYKRLLENICTCSQYVENCTNTFATAVQEAKSVLGWNFSGEKVWRCTEIPPQPWEKVHTECKKE